MGKHTKVRADEIEVDDDWRPLEYLKITRYPNAPTKRETYPYNPHTRTQMGGLEDWMTELLARITFAGDYVHQAITIHHTDGSCTIWRRA